MSLSVEDIPFSYIFFGTSIVALNSKASTLLSLLAMFIEGVKKSFEADLLFFAEFLFTDPFFEFLEDYDIFFSSLITFLPLPFLFVDPFDFTALAKAAELGVFITAGGLWIIAFSEAFIFFSITLLTDS